MPFTKQLPCSRETYIPVGDAETKDISEQKSIELGNVEVRGMGNRNFLRLKVDWSEMASGIGNVWAKTGRK